MTPQEKLELNNLKKEVEDLKKGIGFEFFGNLEDRMILNRPTFPDSVSGTPSGFITVTSIGAGGGSVTHLKAPEYFLQIRYKGKSYYVPAYELQ